MNIGNRIFGVCARPQADNDKVLLSPGTLATNLLLFDSFVMVSCLLAEFPQMVEQFGFEETISLLQTDALEIHCEPTQIISLGSTEESIRNGTPFNYDISVLVAHDHRKYLSSCFDALHKEIPLPEKKIVKLKHALLERLDLRVQTRDHPDAPEFKATRALTTDLEANHPALKRSVIRQLNLLGRKNILPHDFNLRIHRKEGDQFYAETNIRKVFNLNEYDSHNVILQGMLHLGDVKQVFEYMSHYSAICSINEEDLNILDSEPRFLSQVVSPDTKVVQLGRVLELKGFPDFHTMAKTGGLSIEKILELRNTREIKEFRSWLMDSDSYSDADIREQIESITNIIGNFLPTKMGKFLRFIISNAPGFIPGAGIVLGPIASLADSYIPEKLFSYSGPISFINDMLPSVFDLRNREKFVESRGKVLGLE